MYDLVAWCGEGGPGGTTVSLSEVQEAGSGNPPPQTHIAALNEFVFHPGARVAVSKHKPRLFTPLHETVCCLKNSSDLPFFIFSL